ncbi:PTS sugar transporter subunit IIA [Vibrio gazogenes]|uniref:PTS system, fructose-specific IIA component n=1 Tax=Vibrio gazogenes DSM 21264 = NBRC 103151 TaxID=1123492 RepID=A0A1M4YWH9_VIBGA|nr:PTS sugar transporter subunit IIA [Vibrio gazogenes]USP15126.1 PTS sugar transporter subunit IIA [Vibrio gazogenes]SHF10169.1 PTS system, fructose-specific IIA component [Vibrio gazogenes DSM 21264] [Vibrio gazogenes DSM 21264 = NBRC 103151]SJN58368.1 PTS system fructose-specific EIIABC component [Vibrio gazogenes]
MFSKWLNKSSGKARPSFQVDHVIRDPDSTTRDQALRFIAQQMHQAGYVGDVDAFFSALVARETQDTTGFKDQIATPHAKSKQVKHAGIWVVHFANEIPWETMDERPVKTAVAFAIPAKGDETAMAPLIAISRANMKPTFREVLNHGDTVSIVAAIEDAIGGRI